jgi:hypothetical protein
VGLNEGRISNSGKVRGAVSKVLNHIRKMKGKEKLAEKWQGYLDETEWVIESIGDEEAAFTYLKRFFGGEGKISPQKALEMTKAIASIRKLEVPSRSRAGRGDSNRSFRPQNNGSFACYICDSPEHKAIYCPMKMMRGGPGDYGRFQRSDRGGRFRGRGRFY